MNLKVTLIILLLAVITIALRMVRLSDYPPSLTIDEVNNGYSAYSILKTGKDEWGIRLPLSFKSIGDYKPPVLIYLTVPSIALFGLNEFSVRFPVAFFSILAIPLFFILVRKYLFRHQSVWPSLFSAFLLATASWHIIYSRSDFEAVLALSFTISNIIFMFRYLKSAQLKDLLFAGLFAFISLITYHSSKIFVPLINLSFVFLNFQDFKQNLQKNITINRLGFGFLFVLFTGLIIFFIQNYLLGPGSARAQMVFFAVDFDFAHGLMDDINRSGLGFLRPILLLLFWFKRFLEYFSANFYLYSGLELTITGQPGVGVLGFALYPFFWLGLTACLFFKELVFISKKQSLFIVFWLLIGFLPASIANNPQQPLRSLNASVAVLLLAVIGFVWLLNYLRSKSAILVLPLIIIFSIAYFFDLAKIADYYLVHYPVELSEFRQYGWKQIAQYAYSVRSQYDHIYIDPRIGTDGPYTYGAPFLYFLFYNHYDPKIYVNNPLRQTGRTDFENFVFTNINWPDFDHSKNDLYIASPWSFPSGIVESNQQKYHLKFLNGQSGLYAISNK